MFNKFGAPEGYDQIAPGRDNPKMTNPGQPGRPQENAPLQQAIVGPAQYPADPGFQQWRQGSQARPVQSQVMPGQAQSGSIYQGGSPQTQPGQAPTQAGAGASATGQMTPSRDFSFQQGDWKNPEFVSQQMQRANSAAYGYDKHKDVNYWMNAGALQANDPEYAWKQMIGMNAGGADAAKFGEYAGGSAKQPNRPLMSAIMPNQQAGNADYSSIIQSLLQSAGAPQF